MCMQGGSSPQSFSAAAGFSEPLQTPDNWPRRRWGDMRSAGMGPPSLTGVWRPPAFPAAQSGTWAAQTAPPRRSRTPASSARRKPSRPQRSPRGAVVRLSAGAERAFLCRRPHGRAREAQPQAGRRSPRPASAHRFLRSVCNGLRRAIAGHANPAKYRFFASVEARLTACAPARPRRHRAQGRPLPVRSSSASATRRRDRCTRSIRRRLHF